MARGTRLPEGARRLFPDGPPRPTSHGDDTADFLIGRLLEEGDSADLRWLAAALPEKRLGDWLVRRGARQLSRRSYLFWRALLDPAGRRAEPPGGALREALWPL